MFNPVIKVIVLPKKKIVTKVASEPRLSIFAKPKFLFEFVTQDLDNDYEYVGAAPVSNFEW